MTLSSSNSKDLLEKSKIFDHACKIVERLLKTSKSSTISIKLKTLLKYAYVSYMKSTLDIPKLRGLVPRVRIPSKYANQYVYNDLVEVLKKNFRVTVEKRRHSRYVVIYK